jgi:uncharacterized protein YbjT (DUF2867 family)
VRIAVAGGTGVAGRYVVEVARHAGHDVVSLSRSEGVDLTSGDGLAARLEGVDAVVDVTGTKAQQTSAAEAFFGDITRNLLEAEQAAGVGHHIVLSIIGIDRVPSGNFSGKLLQERLVAEGDVPWSILRATQFHEFAEQVMEFARVGPFSLVPRIVTQPVAAIEVARALVDLAEAGPTGQMSELAGPEQLDMVDLARQVSRTKGRGRRVVRARMPGALGRAYRSGGLLPTPEVPRGRITFEDWLAGA